MEDNYPPIQSGTAVKTLQANEAVSENWSESANAMRQWGAIGKVIGYSDSHGLAYFVEHLDGTTGYYDPTELSDSLDDLPEINGRKYAWKPFVAFVFDNDLWGGRSNFISVGQKVPTVYLNDLEECFGWMKRWVDAEYEYGYVLDFENKTVYYDDPRALEHLNKKTFPVHNLEGYFESFVERSFA